MARALKVCSTAGCGELVTAGRCATHRRAADAARGTARDRGYNSKTWRAKRRACLSGRCNCPTRPCQHGPLCVCTDRGHGHDRRVCIGPAGVADHYPESRRDLVARGVADPDALRYLRSLCTTCHNKHTAIAQPGGWHQSR